MVNWDIKTWSSIRVEWNSIVEEIKIWEIITFDSNIDINDINQERTSANFKYISWDPEVWTIDDNWVFRSLKPWITTIKWMYIDETWNEYFTNTITIKTTSNWFEFTIYANKTTLYIDELAIITWSFMLDWTWLSINAQDIAWTVSNSEIIDISSHAWEKDISALAKQVWASTVSASYSYNGWYKLTSNVLEFNVVNRPIKIVRTDAIPWIASPWSQIEFKTIVNTYRTEWWVAYTEIVFDDDRFQDIRLYKDIENLNENNTEHTFVWRYQIPSDNSLNWITVTYTTNVVQENWTRTQAEYWDTVSKLYIWNKADICIHPSLCVIRWLQALETNASQRNDFYKKIVSLFTDFPETFSTNDIYKKFRELKNNN